MSCLAALAEIMRMRDIEPPPNYPEMWFDIKSALTRFGVKHYPLSPRLELPHEFLNTPQGSTIAHERRIENDSTAETEKIIGTLFCFGVLEHGLQPRNGEIDSSIVLYTILTHASVKGRPVFQQSIRSYLAAEIESHFPDHYTSIKDRISQGHYNEYKDRWNLLLAIASDYNKSKQSTVEKLYREVFYSATPSESFPIAASSVIARISKTPLGSCLALIATVFRALAKKPQYFVETTAISERYLTTVSWIGGAVQPLRGLSVESVEQFKNFFDSSKRYIVWLTATAYSKPFEHYAVLRRLYGLQFEYCDMSLFNTVKVLISAKVDIDMVLQRSRSSRLKGLPKLIAAYILYSCLWQNIDTPGLLGTNSPLLTQKDRMYGKFSRLLSPEILAWTSVAQNPSLGSFLIGIEKILPGAIRMTHIPSWFVQREIASGITAYKSLAEQKCEESELQKELNRLQLDPPHDVTVVLQQ